jgi:putative Holliday junction resolvase
VRILGIDYGRRRLGLSLSDEAAILASPLAIWNRARSLDRDLANLARLVEERTIGRIVVGLPLNMDGTEGEMAREARDFAHCVTEATGRPVELFDERLTSAEAERAMLEGNLPRRRRRENRDALAAVLILQGYLESSSREDRAPQAEQHPAAR